MKTWWNFRLVQRDGYVELIEAHYKNKTNPRIYAYAEASAPIGNDVDDFARELANMAEAANRPVLKPYELPGGSKLGSR